MKSHPIIGKGTIKSNVLFSKISYCVHYTHEHIDGKVYFGIKDKGIPIESKLIIYTCKYI
ncbi:protein of unknown function [Tepidibacter aestuarii]|nr:protein of unknown function [Tepidibacter aestuarii]